MSNDNELGPLPKADAKNALSRESVNALKALLPKDQFIFREELIADHGVDGTLEVLLSGSATNLRAHVQVKAQTGLKENKDGSISLEVKTSNINYLLNGTSPFYALYIPEHKMFRFAWARPEINRISKQKPDWKQQDNISIHFHKILDAMVFQEIRETILSETQLVTQQKTARHTRQPRRPAQYKGLN
jgi:hypothetical protein